MRRPVAVLLLLVAAYGAVLRLNALVDRYGVPAQPRWLAAICRVAPLAHWLEPSIYAWPPVPNPYVGGDPIAYLGFARQMRSVYQARVREPVFLALTKAWLWATGGRDIAISFASLTGSIGWVGTTGLLGVAAASPPVGVLAALALAIDYDAIAWAPEGWRDDTFAAFVALAAWALVRLRQRPGLPRAATAGLIGGVALLTRITAVSFLVPGLLWVIGDGPRAERARRARNAGLACAIALALVAPYLVACAREFGDPFVAINVHTQYYRFAAGEDARAPQGALAYAGAKLMRRPLYEGDTALTGLFVRPITKKWSGFDAWIPRLSALLMWCAVAGLVLLAGTADGRLLLVVAFSSLVPYALTWNVGGGGEWRFTMHVYSFLLIAAFQAIGVASGSVLTLAGRYRHDRAPRLPRLAVVPMIVVSVAIASGAALRQVLPPWIAREALTRREPAMLVAGPRDGAFFRDGWSERHTDGNVTARVSLAPRAVMAVPLPSAGDYQLTVRADPVQAASVRRMTLLLNGILLGTWPLDWNPDRVGTYRVRVTGAITHKGMNELTLIADRTVPAGTAGPAYAWLDPSRQAALRLWYVRLEAL